MSGRRAQIAHADIWRALDALAAERGLSTSALARAAGLDPTAFNPSKRQASDGRRRWPGTESVVRALAAIDVSLERFAYLVETRPQAGQGFAQIRVTSLAIGPGDAARPSLSGPAQAPAGGTTAIMRAIGWSDLGRADAFDRAGLPAGRGWGEWQGPFAAGPHGYAVHLDEDVLHPVARPGAVLVMAPLAAIRPGDRVVLRAAEDCPSALPIALPRAAIVRSIMADMVAFDPLADGLPIDGEALPMARIHVIHRIAAICL